MLARHRDPGAFIDARRGFNALTVTAGGAADGVAQNGLSVNRLVDLRDEGEGAAFLLAFSASMATTETAIVSVQFQDSADGSSWANLGSAQTAPTIGGASGAQTPDGVLIFHMGVEGRSGLDSARQFIRAVVTVTLSAGATDTFEEFGIWVVSGARNLEVTPVIN